MPAYHSDPWVVRGRFRKQNPKTTEATSASRPRRISKSTLRLLRISPTATAVAADRPPANRTGALKKAVKKRTYATAAAHSLRSKTRKRNRIKRNANDTTSEMFKPFDTWAMMARAPRNAQSGPRVIGGDGRSPSQEGTNQASSVRATSKAPQRQPARTSRPTSGSRRPPASKRLQETSAVGQRRRT